MRTWLMAILLMLGGCSASLEDYQGTAPPLRLETFFQGPLVARGVFQDYSGKVIRRFTVKLQGQWRDGVGTLDEHFTYADGKTQHRLWTLKALGGGRYSGKASDVVGEAQGRAVGMAFEWHYRMQLKLDDGSEMEVGFEDWMYQLDDKHLLNRSVMKKFGLAVGEVTLFFEKR
ncbi:DUF3833 domain-containing protein [Gallaecimonas kandeliae]|uniref:DUF3833 domain-containing protein n=1 Tax=Gallaecimonas kandeliae TaxID=3029055 RepID=UPI002649E5CC|nr:DUF3833 domain-containing protein [Gallaecimonas kandeliae]WKE63937.1 DUF3833 domain-containing protein [Gallaecimonas kandeliae]